MLDLDLELEILLDTYAVSENILLSTRALLILLMSAFFTKNQYFWKK